VNKQENKYRRLSPAFIARH